MSQAASGSNDQAGTMVSATSCCCKQLSPRVEGLERQVEALTKENKALVTRLDDVQRQYSKHCLVFNGPGLKSLPGELPTKVDNFYCSKSVKTGKIDLPYHQ